MKKLLNDKKVFLIGGPGGVGKTTFAAILGIQLALRGHRTVILTVDPAKRLAQALGFDGFQSELQQVVLPGMKGAGTLFATMLDTQRYFDRVIDRFATSPDQKEKIFRNPLYRSIVESLGGTHEYAAMERLLEFSKNPDFDKIVVDTPPSANAVDLLNAPQRLADFMDNSVLRWFQGPKPLYLQIFRQGTRVAMKFMQKVFGAQFMEALATFMDDLEGMQAGFRNRNLEVIQLLQNPMTAFFLVTHPSEPRHLESVKFVQTLKEKRIPLNAILLNRVEPNCPRELDRRANVDGKYLSNVQSFIRYYHALYQQQAHWISTFKSSFPSIPHFALERQSQPIHDITTLSQLGTVLIS